MQIVFRSSMMVAIAGLAVAILPRPVTAQIDPFARDAARRSACGTVGGDTVFRRVWLDPQTCQATIICEGTDRLYIQDDISSVYTGQRGAATRIARRIAVGYRMKSEDDFRVVNYEASIVGIKTTPSKSGRRYTDTQLWSRRLPRLGEGGFTTSDLYASLGEVRYLEKARSTSRDPVIRLKQTSGGFCRPFVG